MSQFTVLSKFKLIGLRFHNATPQPGDILLRLVLQLQILRRDARRASSGRDLRTRCACRVSSGRGRSPKKILGK